MSRLQLALDFASLKDALRIARAATAYVDWLEAGTPLIKSEGMQAVRALKKAFRGKTIVADMKTMDVGAFEVAMAAKAGADIVTVCGAAAEETIKSAIAEGKKRKRRIAVDLLNVPKAKWKKIDAMKPDYIIFHIGIDQQKKMNVVSTLGNGCRRLKTPVIAAGGINEKTASVLVRTGVYAVIVGSAITKAKNPEKAAREIREAMDNAF